MVSCYVCEGEATGVCPVCSAPMCVQCYSLHGCQQLQEPPPAENEQCTVCAIERGTCICLCQYPCLNYCESCFTKHSRANPPLHFRVEIHYRESFAAFDQYGRKREKMMSMQRLHQDMNDALYKLGTFQVSFNSSFTELLESIHQQHAAMMAEIDSARQKLRSHEELLSAYFLFFLLESEDSTGTPVGKLVAEGYDSTAGAEFTSRMDFAVIVEDLSKAVWFKCGLLDSLGRLSLSDDNDPFSPDAPSISQPRRCSNCQSFFSHSVLVESDATCEFRSLLHDFCSPACLRKFQDAVAGVTEDRV